MIPEKYKKILVKIGTSSISSGNDIRYDWLKNKIHEFSSLVKEGISLSVISSGAVAAGMSLLDMETRSKDQIEIQMLSGIGQAKLIKAFKDEFLKHKINIMQVLLTHHNFSTPNEIKNIRSVIGMSMEKNIIPVINTNDVVTNEEVMQGAGNSFTDNDLLAGLVAKYLDFDLLVILTDVDGLCTLDPNKHDCSSLIETVNNIDNDTYNLASAETSLMGTGGMVSKIKAAEMLKSRADVIVGKNTNNIIDMILGNAKRTIFLNK